LYSLLVDLSTPIKYVRRVGERVAADMAKRGVETVEDLLYHLPFRYEDRLNIQPIASLQANTMASVIGEVRGSTLLETRTGPLFELTVGQGVHSVKAMWFRGSYLQGKFQVGQTVALYGKLEPSRSNAGKFKMVQPQWEILPVPGAPGSGGADAEFALLEMGRIVPIYETLGGTTPWGAKLGSKWVRRLLWSIFEELIEANVQADETIPLGLSGRLGLPSRMEALRAIHFPEAGTPMTQLMSYQTPAHRRLIFEEFFYLELGLELKRKKLREREGTAFTTGPEVREALKQMLPFHPTAAQKRVLAEIVADMRQTRPMRRLLQGDVGSGKTIVALQAALVAIENGYQAAMMAPTEILATQHYLSARKLLGEKVSPRTGRPYRVTLLTGSLKEEMKREGRGRVFRGESDLVIGTHALQEDKVDFFNLGLVIVDEQHRFGVQQRFRLMKKPGPDGRVTDPDVLVMTATPIPRTLALTVYGDLEASVIDELPPGRTPIITRRTTEERAPDVWEFVRKQVALGHQAYLVYPVIEGAKEEHPELDFAQDVEPEASAKTKYGGLSTALRSGRDDASVGGRKGKKTAKKKAVQTSFPKQPLRSAVESFEELRHGALHGLKLGLLHGRLSSDEKEVTMARFKRGEIDVLVATTVIEVGVDVPNASVMVIEHAERFGLAQLHQLRGRVGRGAAKSYCLLVTGAHVSPEADERLDAMVRTQNGFELAELDLQQRGPGEFFGTRQAGLPEFRVANLIRDREVLEMAKGEAVKFAAGEADGISAEEREAVWVRLREQWQRRYGLVEA
jgi:ATP-dependent DNA helicase RecG